MTENQNNGGEQTPADRPRPADIADIGELLFNVTTLFSTRVNLLLLAESIFFAAIASLWEKGDTAIKPILCGLGVAMTILFWFANAALKSRSDHLARELEEVDPVYKRYMAVRSPNVTRMLAHVLPLVMLLAWLLVIYVIVSSQ